MSAEYLTETWRDLPAGAGPGQMAGNRVGSSAVWAAKDHAGQRHLLIEVGPDASVPSTDTRGLRVGIVHCSVAGQAQARYLDLACVDATAGDAFAVVAADILHVAETVPDHERDTAVARRIARWRWFWRSDRPRLSDSDALGLFGELWFLRRWAWVGPSTISAWSGAEGARHDFQWPRLSVEVKAASRRSDGSVIHRIGDLDQLNSPESGDLYLFSLHVRADALATNSLASLTCSLFASLMSTPDIADEFTQKLAQRSYTPLQEDTSSRSYRIVNESLYRVDVGFPRLTPATFREGLPTGITTVSYAIDIAACAPWRIATTPEQWQRP
jgi:putative PD-(D/E)XK family protein DUF4420